MDPLYGRISSFFGWIPPSPERRLRNNLYRLSNLELEAPAPGSVEVTFNHHPEWDTFYTQKNNGCTGFSWSRMMSIYNNKRYDANWLYCKATEMDGDGGTSCSKDTGGYVWACGKVAEQVGMKVYETGIISLSEGVESYYWCENINDIRTAFSLGRPVVLGTFWYEGFIDNITIDDEGRRWFPTDHKKWGSLLGGHAYCEFAWSDRLDGMCLTNSWGKGYPPTWIKSQTILDLLQGNGECCVAIDRGAVTPPPPPVNDTITMKTTYNGKKYKGILRSQ